MIASEGGVHTGLQTDVGLGRASKAHLSNKLFKRGGNVNFSNISWGLLWDKWRILHVGFGDARPQI